MEPSLFPCLPLSGLCCYGLYNYLVINWWRSFYCTVCKVLYSLYEGDFLNYPITPLPPPASLSLALLFCLSYFRRCLSNDPEQPSVPLHPPLPPLADELKVFLWHWKPWWRIQRQEANRKLASLR